jgi:2-(1,2-epoxy-1,2-dihydrophenyl)acetyl-CoA isomerase
LSYETLLYETATGVATITLTRPEVLNATNDALYRDLSAAIGAVREDPEARCIILTGAGRGFCAGADVRNMDPDASPLKRRKRHRWILRDVLAPLARLDKPVIAAVNGAAVGAGFNMALAADILVASENAVFSQIFVRLGLVPDLGGFYLLTRVVGLNKAKELCFTGRKLTAKEGAELGFVNHVVPAGELISKARALAEEIAAGPATSLSMIKSILNMSSTATLDEMLEFETYAQTLAYGSPEHPEGVAAFREKRQPRFAGL